MSAKVLFLSHAHEERDLARLIKDTLESEFSGFVDVFVSSDGVSIPAGSNFLKRIEDGLITCVGAVYLISPMSVRRSWISFELGAVWIRNVASLRANGPEIPTLPMCHSGMTPATLPAPLNNLNAIIANQASQLQFAFRSLQSAVGGKGQLKTNFDALAASVTALERGYMLGANLKRLFSNLDRSNMQKLVDHVAAAGPNQVVPIGLGFVETAHVRLCQALEANELKGQIQVTVSKPGTSFTSLGAVNGAEVEIKIAAGLIQQFKDQLLAA